MTCTNRDKGRGSRRDDEGLACDGKVESNAVDMEVAGYNKSNRHYDHNQEAGCHGAEFNEKNTRFTASILNYGIMGVPKMAKELKRKAKQRICSNCSTTSTPSWRRGNHGKSLLCNACGLYQKLHGRTRPYTMTPGGRTKALKGGHDKVFCISCNTSSLLSEVRNTNSVYVCDPCMTQMGSQKEQFHDEAPVSPGRYPQYHGGDHEQFHTMYDGYGYPYQDQAFGVYERYGAEQGTAYLHEYPFPDHGYHPHRYYHVYRNGTPEEPAHGGPYPTAKGTPVYPASKYSDCYDRDGAGDAVVESYGIETHNNPESSGDAWEK